MHGCVTIIAAANGTDSVEWNSHSLGEIANMHTQHFTTVKPLISHLSMQ